MMKISVNTKDIGISGYRDIMEKIQELMRKEKAKGELGITFCDDRFIRNINKKYRKKDKATDVLSFNLGDGKKIMGDIYISIPTAKRQAKEYNVPLKDEILRLAMHGTLHVLGYNHKEMGIYGS